METRLDLKKNCQKIFDDIIALDIQVNILINHAGIGSSGFFEDFPESFYEKQINLNINAVVFLHVYFCPYYRNSPLPIC